MKVQIYIEDVPADGGAFGYVPGSHKPDVGPCPVVRPLDSMPGHKVYSGQSGRCGIIQFLWMAYIDGQPHLKAAQVDHPHLRKMEQGPHIDRPFCIDSTQMHNARPAGGYSAYMRDENVGAGF